MLRKVKCKNCSEIKKEKGTRKCYNCNTSGCNNCIKLVCSDCSEIMCENCRGNDENRCRCYGNCYCCYTAVDRGNNGWPCYKCKKWYCSDCKHNSNCKECKSNNS